MLFVCILFLVAAFLTIYYSPGPHHNVVILTTALY